jgi:transposase
LQKTGQIMQTQLPFFPAATKLINDTVGFREQDGTVYYLHNGNPIYCHCQDDRNGYRFALANLVVNKLCTISELSCALGERRKNIERYAKAYREHGTGYFFSRQERRGKCYKMTTAKLAVIQSELDQGLSIYRIALNQEISEAAITYHIKKGTLKKTLVL